MGFLVLLLGSVLLGSGFFKRDRRYGLGFRFSGKMMLAGLILIGLSLLLMAAGI